MDYVTQKCKCNNGYEFNGSKCVFKNTYINPPVLSSPTISTSPIIPTKIPIVKPKSNDQICQSSYGVNSNWNGTKNDKGGLVCDCKGGYQWNQGQTGCILIPSKVISSSGGGGSGGSVTKIPAKTITPIIDNKNNKKGESDEVKNIYDAICKKQDPNTFYYGVLNDLSDPLCGCKKGYIRLNVDDKCILEDNLSKKDSDSEVIKETVFKQDNIETNNASPKSLWRKIIGWFGF